MSERSVSVERVIPADRQAIFDLLADPSKHPMFDGSGTVKTPRGGNPHRLSLGARFGMDMVWLLPYRIRSEVVEFEEPHRIAWCHFAGHRWRYELEAVDGGTRVIETFDYDAARFPPMYRPMGLDRNAKKGMTATLERLAAHFGETSSGA